MASMKEAVKKQDLDDSIRRAFQNSLGSRDIEMSRYNKGKSPFGFGFAYEGDADNRESEWLVFTSEKDAEREAFEMVKQDLETEPELFNQSFLQQYITMTPTDIRVIANEEADAYVDGSDEDDLIDEADMSDNWAQLEDQQATLEGLIDDLYDQIDDAESEGKDVTPLIAKQREYQKEIDSLSKKLDDELIEEAKDKVREKRYEEVKAILEKDPIAYFTTDYGIYEIDDLLKQPFIKIDIKKAAQAAIDEDGVAHFLDHYDGEEEEIVDPEEKATYYVYGIN